MASDTQNVKLGVCKITFDGIDLGYTQGGVEVTVTTETHKSMVDQFGKTPINEYIDGRTCVVRAPLAETTLENLVAIMPGSTLVGTGTKRVDVKTGIGINLLSLAKALVLHPIGNAAGDLSEDFNVPLAATAGALQFAYKQDAERLYNVEFNAYPDPATSKLFSIGDPAAV